MVNSGDSPQGTIFFGAIEGTRTPTPLPVHGPEPCASANSATMAIWTCNAAAAPRPPCQEDQLFYFTAVSQAVKPSVNGRSPKAEARSPPTPASLSSKF